MAIPLKPSSYLFTISLFTYTSIIISIYLAVTAHLSSILIFATLWHAYWFIKTFVYLSAPTSIHALSISTDNNDHITWHLYDKNRTYQATLLSSSILSNSLSLLIFKTKNKRISLLILLDSMSKKNDAYIKRHAYHSKQIT